MTRRSLRILTAALALMIAVLPAAASAESINVYNWGQYISDGTDGYIDVNRRFTEETGIEVNYMTFDSNESLYTRLKTGGSTYDVIIPSDYMIGRLIEEGLLLPLNYDNIPNYQYVDEAYKNTAYDPDNLYSVPYTWGTVGVIYNSAYVDEEDVGSWELLWNEKYAGKILMFDNPRDAFAVAESLLGFSLNDENEEDLRAAAFKLMEQKPLVQAYVMDQIFDKMERGEAWIAPYYAGDYLLMAEENPDLRFYFPSEGFNLFIDAMCIPTCAQNISGAEAYINFLCDPEISGCNMDYVGYSVPQTAAREWLEEETASSPVAYPDEETLSRGESFLNLSTETSQLMDSLWLEVKTQGGVSTGAMIAMGVFIACFAGALIARSAVRRHRRKNRCLAWKQPAETKD